MPVQSEPMGKRSCPSPSPSDGLSTRKSFRSHFVYYIYRHIYIYIYGYRDEIISFWPGCFTAAEEACLTPAIVMGARRPGQRGLRFGVVTKGTGRYLARATHPRTRSPLEVLAPKATVVLNLLVGMTGTGSCGGPQEIEAMVTSIQKSLGHARVTWYAGTTIAHVSC